MKRYVIFKNRETVEKFARNLLKFTAPALGLFFFQLSQDVDVKIAGGVALLALYGLIADALKKMGEER